MTCDKSRTYDFRQPESSLRIQGQANWGAAQCRGGHSLFVQEPCQRLFLSRIGHQTFLMVGPAIYVARSCMRRRSCEVPNSGARASHALCSA